MSEADVERYRRAKDRSLYRGETKQKVLACIRNYADDDFVWDDIAEICNIEVVDTTKIPKPENFDSNGDGKLTGRERVRFLLSWMSFILSTLGSVAALVLSIIAIVRSQFGL